ncbi:hypothetical protein GCM10009742_25790 [Kribbella karoonensis]|uniref:Uncharacterized protein n=1 Tax=Kribbella karoonensis TaxID=324851 RepID=A0ABN2DM32_9ACTN
MSAEWTALIETTGAFTFSCGIVIPVGRPGRVVTGIRLLGPTGFGIDLLVGVPDDTADDGTVAEGDGGVAAPAWPSPPNCR